jgi:primosomal replication protein N
VQVLKRLRHVVRRKRSPSGLEVLQCVVSIRPENGTLNLNKMLWQVQMYVSCNE